MNASSIYYESSRFVRSINRFDMKSMSNLVSNMFGAGGPAAGGPAPAAEAAPEPAAAPAIQPEMPFPGAPGGGLENIFQS